MLNRCKVVVTYFGLREERRSAVFPRHCQPSMTAVDCLKMNQTLLRRTEPGVHLIIVNNDAGYKPGRIFLESLRSEYVTVDHRPNVGGSFDAYDFAFQRYRNDFHWWLFSEDDIFIRPRYNEIIERFEREQDCGFLALVGVEFCDELTHAHGGVGLTTSSILEEVCKANNGCLPHPGTIWRFNDLESRRKIESNGEIAFTNAIFRLGYRLVPFGSNAEHDTAIPWANFRGK